jgi:hypothetical protein
VALDNRILAQAAVVLVQLDIAELELVEQFQVPPQLWAKAVMD